MSSPRQSFWSLYDQMEDHQIDGLQLHDVVLIVRSIAPKNRNHWLAWKTGEKSWKPLLEFSEIEQGSKEEAPPLPGMGPDEEVTKTVTFIRVGQLPNTEEEGAVGTGSLMIEDMDTEDRRSSTRFHKSFKIKIEGTSGQVFKTNTLDVSLDGVQLQEAVPDWSGELFRMELWRGDEHIDVLCERTGKGEHTTLIIRENPREELLRKWLLG